MTTEDKKAEVEALEKKLKELRKARKEAEEHDWVADAQEIMDKMSEEFPDGWNFLTQSKTLVQEDLHVTAPNGRVRNLWRSITGKPAIKAAAGRRATNSPVQGFASEAGTTAGYLILQAMDTYTKHFGVEPGVFIQYCRAVHDANYYHVPYELVIPQLHIVQYCSTYGVAQYYEQQFGFKFLVEPEIELDIAAHDAKGHTWDWSLPNLADCIVNSLLDQVSIGVLNLEDVQATANKICRPWRVKETRAYLQGNYPLLGVKELGPQIAEFLSFMKDVSPKVEAYVSAVKPRGFSPWM